MKHARTSPNLGKVHLIPQWTGGGQRPGAQSAVCGMIPTTDPDRWGTGRWFWTEDAVDCRRCLTLGQQNS